jgi:hypothetical protein
MRTPPAKWPQTINKWSDVFDAKPPAEFSYAASFLPPLGLASRLRHGTGHSAANGRRMVCPIHR